MASRVFKSLSAPPVLHSLSFATRSTLRPLLCSYFCLHSHPELQAIADPAVRFRTTMCTVQGAVLITGIVQVVLGYTGVLAFLLRFISPVSIAPTVAMVGLGLYGAMNGNMIGGEWLWAGECWE